MNKIKDLLQKTNDADESRLSRCHEFLIRSDITGLAFQWEEASKQPDTPGFNLFRLISSIYQRENLHSDIIKSLLDPDEEHGAGHHFLHLFIDWLKKLEDGKLSHLNAADFQDSVVAGEQGRVDILIHDKQSKKAIVIENKISNAVDQERQIPRYLDYCDSEDWQVVAIVYLTLGGGKKPTEIGWKAADRERVERLLIRPAACDKTDFNMTQGWLGKCEDNANHADAIFTIRQYRKLLHYLKGKTMDYKLMEDFFAILQKDDCAAMETALQIRSMMDDLIQFRAERLKRKFLEIDPKPFECVEVWKNENNKQWAATVLKFNSLGVILDLAVTSDKYEIRFWEQDFSTHATDRIDKFAHSFPMAESYSVKVEKGEPYYSRIFNFTPKKELEVEAKVVAEIKSWIEALRRYNKAGLKSS